MVCYWTPGRQALLEKLQANRLIGSLLGGLSSGVTVPGWEVSRSMLPLRSFEGRLIDLENKAAAAKAAAASDLEAELVQTHTR